MKEDKHFMKNCPSCLREVPSFWDNCYFCGNVFRKTEGGPETPSMLYWNREPRNKKLSTLFISDHATDRVGPLRDKLPHRTKKIN